MLGSEADVFPEREYQKREIFDFLKIFGRVIQTLQVY